jgi:murein DD-endopeptidase MepM/ murein hydrolase activator NlpD
MSNTGKTGSPSVSGKHSAAGHSAPFIRTGLTLAALGLFVTAAALAVVKPSSHDTLPDLYQASQALELPNPFPAPLNNFSQPFIHQTRIQRGDTLAVLLSRLDVHESGLMQFLVQNKSARSIYKLYPGRTLAAGLNSDGSLAWLRYNHTPGSADGHGYVSKWLEIKPDGKGGFTAAEESAVADTQIRMAEGEIESSLFGATDKADIPDAVTLQMADILGSKVDFIKDLRKGDHFRIVYQTFSHNGKYIGAGRVLAVEFTNRGHTYDAVWFQPKKGKGGYYDFSGRSLKGAFLRNSIKFTRISSTYGMRFHPLHHKWVKHQGVDYAAPKGTPIHATANGTVKFIGRQRGYGNIIILQHRNHYSTVYAHQSRFAKGLHKGDHVSQGQVIGYVGATGWATGPHLHYEFRINNKAVNPLSVKLPVAFKLDDKQLAAFKQSTARYKAQIKMLADLQNGHIQLASR